MSGDFERARQLQAAFGRLNPRFREAGTFPAGIKTALDLLGRPGG
jgi:dihydrodipicolinate synthase/N-acetylneuraminate lyase